MKGIELFQRVKSVSTFTELLNAKDINNDSKRGNLFEKMWDLIIKFGCCSLFPNDTFNHYKGNLNINSLKKVENLELYVQKLSIFSKGEGGSSDITLQNKNNENNENTKKWIFISVKYYKSISKSSNNIIYLIK